MDKEPAGVPAGFGIQVQELFCLVARGVADSGRMYVFASCRDAVDVVLAYVLAVVDHGREAAIF